MAATEGPPPPAAQDAQDESSYWKFQIPPILLSLGREYLRALIFSIPPTIVYIVISPFLWFPAYPTLPFPSLFFLGLLCIVSCFVLGDNSEPEGYFYSIPTNWEKGIRVTAVKILEVTAEYGAYQIFVAYQIRELYFGPSYSFLQNVNTAVAVYLISVMCISGLRCFLIFPWIVLSLRWSYRLPLCWITDKPKEGHQH